MIKKSILNILNLIEQYKITNRLMNCSGNIEQ